MSFWESLKEAILEFVVGRSQLEAWREEKQQREECERALQRHYEAFKKLNP